MTSVYWWEGKVTTENEFQLHLKTTCEREVELIDYIRKHHPYEVAEIISIPISSISPEYLSWLIEATGG
ncbi:MAG: divalent-cation tolerance protein CutA [Candidatus Sabulitectum sp.]|nr:divalent-cation tolerance protein CutA [Candidatus Sabulitectum sp.]